MIHRVRWPCAALAAAALVAACGGGGHSTTTTTSTTKIAHTTTSKTTTSSASTTVTKSTTSSSVKTTSGGKAQLLSECKSEATTLTTELGSILPANFKSDINSICEKVASGNIKGAKALEVALCNRVAANMPTGSAKAAIENACKSIGKSAG